MASRNAVEVPAHKTQANPPSIFSDGLAPVTSYAQRAAKAAQRKAGTGFQSEAWCQAKTETGASIQARGFFEAEAGALDAAGRTTPEVVCRASDTVMIGRPDENELQKTRLRRSVAVARTVTDTTSPSQLVLAGVSVVGCL